MFNRALAILLLASTSVFAQTKIIHYVSVGGGIAGLAEDRGVKYDPGYAIELVYGAEIDNGYNLPARLEVALSHQSCGIKEIASVPSDETATMLSLFGNAYLDFPTKTIITPYIMAGLGAGTLDYDQDDASDILFQLGLGAGFELSENWILDVKWQGFGALDAKEYSIGGAKLLLGARYMF